MQATVAAAMTQQIVFCRPDDPVSAVWSKMKQQGLRHIPVSTINRGRLASSMRETLYSLS